MKLSACNNLAWWSVVNQVLEGLLLGEWNGLGMRMGEWVEDWCLKFDNCLWFFFFLHWVMSRSDTIMMTTTATTSDLNRTGTVERDIEQVSIFGYNLRNFKFTLFIFNRFLIVCCISNNATKCLITTLVSS